MLVDRPVLVSALYQNGPVYQTRQDMRAVHICNSWFVFKIVVNLGLGLEAREKKKKDVEILTI